MITTPSGVTFDGQDVNILRGMHRCGFVRYSDEPIRLKSGVNSYVYVLGRDDLTDNPDLMYIIGRKICDLVHRHHYSADDAIQPCLIGIPSAGTVLAVAASVVSTDTPRNLISCRTMRQVKKSHGAHQMWVDGKADLKRHVYWLVDNVATNGDSKFEAAQKFAEDGYPSRPPCFIWIDRQQGAVNRLREAGFERVVVGYNLLDLTYAYGELNLWPKDTVKRVEDEIAAHQFV